MVDPLRRSFTRECSEPTLGMVSRQLPPNPSCSCPTCTTTSEESALNETLGVQYNLASIKHQLDREELLPIVDPAFRIDLGAGAFLPMGRWPIAITFNH